METCPTMPAMVNIVKRVISKAPENQTSEHVCEEVSRLDSEK